MIIGDKSSVAEKQRRKSGRAEKALWQAAFLDICR
jgi:hypothetical protein